MQKFHYGDLVRVAKDLGECMSHFQSDCDAIVIGSYADKYGGSNVTSYTLYIKDKGQHSWYYESQLSLIENGRIDLLQKWKLDANQDKIQKSDLDWIFANGCDVLLNGYGASIRSLADCLGIGDLWGPNGEGFVYYENCMIVLQLASTFLEEGDKDGWIDKCKEFQNSGL